MWQKYKYEVVHNGDLLAPDTYFVLRYKDVASTIAGYTYARALRLIVDLDDSLTEDEIDDYLVLAYNVERLMGEWEAGDQRLPT